LLVVHSLRRHLVDEVVMPGVEPGYVALAVQRDRLPGRLAVGATKIVAAMQSVLGVLDGGVPDLLFDLVWHDRALSQILDAKGQAVDVGAGGRQRAFKRVEGGDDLAVAVAREQAHDRRNPLLQGFLVCAHGLLNGGSDCFASLKSHKFYATIPST